MRSRMKRLQELARNWHIELSEKQLEQFQIYYEYLLEVNQVMNLTAITQKNEVIWKHFLDSLSIVQAVDLKSMKYLIDVGTGAGFPGIPLKIAFPHLHVTLMDSLNKRVKFLNETGNKLGLDNMIAIHSRAEELGKNKEHREKYDLCVSRAVANLSVLSEYCLPFVKIDGYFVSYKGNHIEEESRGASCAIEKLGGKIEKQIGFTLPESDIERTFIQIKKVRQTPGKYPRKAGLPAKEPL